MDSNAACFRRFGVPFSLTVTDRPTAAVARGLREIVTAKIETGTARIVTGKTETVTGKTETGTARIATVKIGIVIAKIVITSF